MVRKLRVISRDIAVFVPLIFWVWCMQLTVCVQLDWWSWIILKIYASSFLLGPKSLQFTCMDALLGCDNVSFSHGRAMALNMLTPPDQSGLCLQWRGCYSQTVDGHWTECFQLTLWCCWRHKHGICQLCVIFQKDKRESCMFQDSSSDRC